MTASQRSESELTSLRKVASELATSRKERPTTVHLLAAVASRAGAASELLRERGLDRDVLLKAGRSFDEEIDDPLTRALTQAREVSKRARGPVSTDSADRSQPSISPDSRLVLAEPSGLHVLVSLLSERRFAAFRALELSGVDAIRLRTAALSLALGTVAPRRFTSVAREAPASERPRPAPPRSQPSVVPLSPKLVERPRPTPTPAPIAPRDRPRGLRRMVPAVREERPRRELPPETTPPVLLRPASARTEPAALPAFLASVASSRSHDARVVCREQEVERVLDVLAKYRGNAPCLVGPAGVGKTSLAHALVEPLAQQGARLVEINASALLAGTGARGALAERIANLFDDARQSSEKLALFVDDVHELLGAGDEAVAELKLQLSRGDVAFAAATSSDSYRRALEGDPQLARRFVTIEIEPPEEDAAFFMVKAASDALGAHHRVSYSDEAIASAVSWSIRYLPGRALPDKAIAALDFAGARARRARGATSSQKLSLGPAEIAAAMADLADVPIERLLETDRERMLALEELLGARVVGHKDELARIAGHLRKTAAGLRGRRPLGSFLLLGPTGVGKTETAKAIAAALFGSADAMTRIDLSEYAEAHAVARLIGAPPGYVGHEAGGHLTESLRKRPYQVVLLDEIEKAHADVLLAFLQVLDEGHLTDGRGRRVDFTNAVVLCTSNLGSRDVASAMKGSGVGFARQAGRPTAQLSEIAIGAAKKSLPLELFNRFDEVMFFAPLSRAEVGSVARLLIAELEHALEARDVALEVEDSAIDHLLDAGGFDAELGARPMRRAVARLLEAPIAELLLRGQLPKGSTVLVSAEDGGLIVDSIPPRAKAAS